MKTKPGKVLKKLTHVTVEQALKRSKPYEVGDAGCLGLRLLVHPSGRKSWLFRYRRPTGETANLTLGIVDTSADEPTETPKVGDPLTLASAHALVADLRRALNRGVDPGAQHLAEKRRVKSRVDESDKSTFAAAALAFVREYARPKQRKWQANSRVLGIDPYSTDPEFAVIKGSLADIWGARKVADITDAEITAAIDRCRYHGVPGLPRRVKPGAVTESRARTLYDALSRLFSWLKKRGVIRVNPIESGVEAPEGAGERDRKLSDQEIRWFWFACDDLHPTLATALRLLLVTGQRLREITEMETEELGHDEAQMALHPNADPSKFRVINLPSTRTKNKRAHTVHLSPLAVKLIDGVNAKGKFVFSHSDGKTPISVSGDVKARLFARMTELARAEKGTDFVIPHFVLHDARHTFAKGCQRNNTPVNIIELCLNHVAGSSKGIAKYLSHDYPLECRQAMNQWATLLQSILASGHKLKLVS